jgi:hypothetical protein
MGRGDKTKKGKWIFSLKIYSKMLIFILVNLGLKGLG